jgi:hypothetical protein
MSSNQYLYRRASGTYFIRLCVPARLKSAVGKGEIHRTTGCRDYRLAKIVAAELAAHWHRAIQALERMDITKIKAGSIKLLGDGYVTLTEAAEALGATPLALANQLVTRRAHFFVETQGWRGWSVDDIYEALHHNHDELGQVEVVIDESRLGGLQAQVKFNGRLRIRYHDDVISIIKSDAPVGVCQFLLGPSPLRGFICDLPGQPITSQMLEVRQVDVEALRLGLANQVTPAMLAVASPPPRVSSDMLAAVDDSMKFSEFIVEYTKRKCGHLKHDQRRRRADQCQIFLDLMGDLRLAKIGRTTLRLFSDRIAKIPDERHNVKRKYRCPNASFSELIKLADEHNLPRLTINSQHRLLDGLSEIFDWAATESMMAKNPAKGLGGEVWKNSGATGTKPQDQRDPLSQDNLNQIFAATWFQKGTGEKTKIGKFYAYRPHYFWLPLLALLNGGRLNELSQLYLSDLPVIEGVACLDFNLSGADKMDVDEVASTAPRATDKSLKTVNATRIVPIHQTLLDLGLLDYADALRNKGHTRLFPELKFDKNKGYGKAAGSWFNERFLGIQLGIERNGRKCFHSMRHNFATVLGAASCEINTKSDFMGHARTGSQAEIRYDKGTLEKLKANIDAVTYSLPHIEKFNVKDGLQAVRDAVTLKESRGGGKLRGK